MEAVIQDALLLWRVFPGGPSGAACVPEVCDAIGATRKRTPPTRVNEWQHRLHPRYEYYNQTWEALTKRHQFCSPYQIVCFM